MSRSKILKNFHNIKLGTWYMNEKLSRDLNNEFNQKPVEKYSKILKNALN